MAIAVMIDKCDLSERRACWLAGLSRDKPITGQTGLSREQLYRSFSENGNPTLTTLAVMQALSIELTAKVSESA